MFSRTVSAPPPHPVFGRASICLPFPESHRKESRAAIFVWRFSMSATEKQNQPNGLFNCNMKIMLFQGKQGAFSTPSGSSTIPYLLIRSHSNPNKHIYHHKNCHLGERSPQACISPQMFPSPIKPGAEWACRGCAVAPRRPAGCSGPPRAGDSQQEPCTEAEALTQIPAWTWGLSLPLSGA